MVLEDNIEYRGPWPRQNGGGKERGRGKKGGRKELRRNRKEEDEEELREKCKNKSERL